MNKVSQLILEPELFEPIKGKTIKSMTNKAYKKNVPCVQEIIVKQQHKNEKVYNKIKDKLIN